MTRTLLVVLCVVLFTLALWGMRRGWLNRAGRQSDLPALPPVPDTIAPITTPLVGVFVGTTYAASWQDRVAAHGLSTRSNMTATLGEAGVLIDREGADSIFIPTAAIVEARLAPGLAGKVMGAGGLLVVRWRLGTAEVDTGLRGDDKPVYVEWVRAINERVKAVHD